MVFGRTVTNHVTSNWILDQRHRLTDLLFNVNIKLAVS